MVITPWIGALFIIGGVLYMAGAAIFRGRMSDPHVTPTGVRTLEPSRRGVRFLGITTNWPGLLLIAIGAIMLVLVPLSS